MSNCEVYEVRENLSDLISKDDALYQSTTNGVSITAGRVSSTYAVYSKPNNAEAPTKSCAHEYDKYQEYTVYRPQGRVKNVLYLVLVTIF